MPGAYSRPFLATDLTTGFHATFFTKSEIPCPCCALLHLLLPLRAALSV